MLPFPTNIRETLEVFRYYRPDVGIRRLLQEIDFTDVSPRHIYQAVHGRPPDSLEAALPPANYNPVTNFLAALSSVEFQQNLAVHFLRAFPEKRRLFFVHIPKTAGVELATHLICRFPSINTNLLNRTLTPKIDDLFLAIKHILLEMACSDTVFISGHTHLGTYQSWAGNGIRGIDKVFTVVREPMSRILSQVNYVLMRIFAVQTPMQPDTAGWRGVFKVEDLEIRHSRDRVLELAREILHHPGVVVPDIQCEFIGGKGCDEAVARTVVHDLEVIELKQLDAWMEQNWGVREPARLNTSEKLVSFPDFSQDDIDYCHSIVQEDLKYYQKVQKALERHGGSSIRGAQIVAGA